MDQNLFCSVCNISLGYLRKKFECSNCKLLACKHHSSLHDNFNYYCTNCQKLIIKRELFSDYLYQIQSLKSELNSLSQQKNKYKSNISSKNNIINRFQTQYNAAEVFNLEKVRNTQSKIIEEQSKIISEHKLIEYLQESLSETRKNEKNMSEKLCIYIQEIKDFSDLYNELYQDQQFLLNKLDQIYKSLRGVIQVSRVKLLCCSRCYRELKKSFPEVFITASILNGRCRILRYTYPSNSTKPKKLNYICGVCKFI